MSVPAFALLATAGASAAWSADSSGTASLHAWLRQAGLDRASISLDVRPIDGGPPLLQYAPGAALNPASTIKLFTTYVALDELGPDYRWETRFFLDGALNDGRLDGDLRMSGGGDPKFVVEDLTAMLAQMHAKGLQHITGDLIIDNSLYEPRSLATTFDGLPAEPYNVQPDAALMNFKSVKFTVSPSGNAVQIALDPPLAGVAIDNAVTLVVGGGCRHGAGGLRISDSIAPGQPVIHVGGRYSVACGESSAFHAVLDQITFTDAFFRAGWTLSGGRWDGRARALPPVNRAETRIVDRQSLPDIRPTPWLTWQSPRTLADVITDINKFSNNVMTRQLLLHLGAMRGGRATPAPASEADGREVVHRWLRANGIATPRLILDNGAGLSREARTSARELVDLLRHAARGKHAWTMRESLPIVGVDGTMRRRLRDHPLAGRTWIKTGSIAGVRSIAGYVSARSGRLHALAFIVNAPNAENAFTVQDDLLRWIFDNG